MEVFTLTQINSLLSQVWSIVTSNAVGILIVMGTILGLSFVAYWIDEITGQHEGTWIGPSGKSYKYRK